MQVQGAVRDQDNTRLSTVETDDLRKMLADFLDTPVVNPLTGDEVPIGNFQWGVYVFFDYDDEPIYLGQTNERLRTRIRRHLTNQRTDAVAMSVLDPSEVFAIEVWPLPQFQHIFKKSKIPFTPAERDEAKAVLNSLEHGVYYKTILSSRFHAILNEKNPSPGKVPIDLSTITPIKATIVSERVQALRAHPDYRLARRALIISRLAQVISERKVQNGLRRVLLTQARRLEWLARRRFEGLGGEATVAVEGDGGDGEE